MTTPAWASGVCEGIHAAGSRDVVYVPDNPLSHVLRELDDRFRDIRLLLATREEEAFGIAAGQSLLMNLGSLATIGLLRPANLVLVVMDNEEYATTGGQKTPTAHGADLDAAARAMGVPRTATVRSEAELADVARPFHPSTDSGCPEPVEGQGREGAAVIIAKVSESAPTGKPPLDCVFIKQRFMSALGNPEPATSGAVR